jgi:hypothetical protein
MKETEFLKSGRTTLKALVLMVTFGIMAHAGLPYLPLVGPPALRLMVAKDPHAAVVPLNAESTNSANSLAAIEVSALNGGTNSLTDPTNSLADTLPLIGVGTFNSFTEKFGTPILNIASPEFLNITPQMLAAYFGPVAWGTNGGFVGPFPAGFVPPFAQREHSSHAEYQVK